MLVGGLQTPFDQLPLLVNITSQTLTAVRWQSVGSYNVHFAEASPKDAGVSTDEMCISHAE